MAPEAKGGLMPMALMAENSVAESAPAPHPRLCPPFWKILEGASFATRIIAKMIILCLLR